MTDLDFVYRGIVAIAYWGARPEMAGSLSDKFVAQIDELAAIDKTFELWTCGARRPKNFETVRSRFVDEVEDSIVKDDFGEPDPIFGYSVGAVTRKKKLSFHAQRTRRRHLSIQVSAEPSISRHNSRNYA